MALGVRSLDDLATEIEELTTPKMPAGMLDALKMLPMVSRLTDLMPKTVSDAPCQEVVQARRLAGRDADPEVLARGRRALHHAAAGVHQGPRDRHAQHRHLPHAGVRRAVRPACTGSGTRGARSTTASPSAWGGECLSRSRSVADPALHLRRHRADARRARRADARRLPPPRARRAREVRHASTSKCRPTPRSSSRATSSPASAAAKGRSAITPASTRTRTTIRSSTSRASRTAKRPIYLTTVVGMPPMEDYYLGKASERIFLPLIRKTLPEIVDMHFPAAGIFHNIVLISIDKRYPGHARKIMNAVWGLGPADVLEDDHRRRQGRRRAERGGGRVDRRHALSIPSATSSSRAGRSTTSRTPAICRPTAARWASTRRASGRPRGSRARGRRASHHGAGGAAGRRDLGEDPKRMEVMAGLAERVSRGDAIDENDAQAILDGRDLIAVGVAATTVRRRRHGAPHDVRARVRGARGRAACGAAAARQRRESSASCGRPRSADAAVSAVRRRGRVAGANAGHAGFRSPTCSRLRPGTSLGAFCARARALRGSRPSPSCRSIVLDDVGAAVESRAPAAGWSSRG